MKITTTVLLGFLFLAAGVFTLAFMTEAGEAAIITVDDSGNADYETIQGAINAAQKGDTIKVWEGSYKENVVVNKSVSLIGNGSESTIIDGGGSETVVNITADWVNMSGFGVTGSKLSSAGIKVESNHTSIDYNNCSNNFSWGIYLYYSRDCMIGNNSCQNNVRSGIYLYRSSDIMMADNICSENNDFGIILRLSHNSTITDNTCSSNNDSGIGLSVSNGCTITKNFCENNGYGIGLGSSNNSIIANNICSFNNYYGLWISSSTGCKISYNTCENSRYGIRLHTNSNDCTISNNIFSLNSDHGVSFYRSSDCTISGNTISGNGVGICLEYSSKGNTAHYNNITNNTEYGIDASSNNFQVIKTTNNYWGSDKGPYHPTRNPEGKGDIVSDNVEFKPWLDEHGNSIGKDEDDEDPFCFYGLLMSVLVLLVVLGLVVRLPDESFSFYEPFNSKQSPEHDERVENSESK